MPYLIDGNNLLGRSGHDRQSADAKRLLVKRLAALARARSATVVCVFDGPDPGNFARSLGAVSVVFAGSRSADAVIVERASRGQGWKLVTADQQLAARAGGRRVTIIEPRRFLEELDKLPADPSSSADGDWEAWLNDPKNRNV